MPFELSEIFWVVFYPQQVQTKVSGCYSYLTNKVHGNIQIEANKVYIKMNSFDVMSCGQNKEFPYYTWRKE